MRKRMKSRWLCLLLGMLLLVSLLAGCGKGAAGGTGTAQENAPALATITQNGQDTVEGEPSDTGQAIAAGENAGNAAPEMDPWLTEEEPADAGAPETDPAETGEPETSLALIESDPAESGPAETLTETLPAIDEDGSYTTKEDVALYIHTYGRLPSNFITKKQAEKLGWTGGSLEPYAPGKCIGGSHFGNYEGVLPDGNYKECDIGTLGKKSRGAKRLIYSDDGRIYYTEDHYKTFTQLY